jgi:integrase/recombinase XerC
MSAISWLGTKHARPNELLHRLAQIMGHDSLDTTRLYIQGTKHDLQQAVETIAWT